MFKKILVPVDGSNNSYKAIETVSSLVEKFGSKVTLLYVIAVPARNPGFAPELNIIPQRVLDDLEEAANKILQEAAGVLRDTEVETIVKVGHPAQEIVTESAQGYDLVVMGSRGLGEIKGFLLGSVSDRVSHHARCTVMLVH